MQSFQTSGDIYFYAQEQLKNKGFKGLMVAIGDSGRAQKAKKDSVSNFNLWKEVPESKVPSDVKSKAKARMASEDPWKVAAGLQLWKYNWVTGLWHQERSVTPETQNQWLAKFEKDEPEEAFVVSPRKPKGPPKNKKGPKVKKAEDPWKA